LFIDSITTFEAAAVAINAVTAALESADILISNALAALLPILQFLSVCAIHGPTRALFETHFVNYKNRATDVLRQLEIKEILWVIFQSLADY
jgi:hypothetical protein